MKNDNKMVGRDEGERRKPKIKWIYGRKKYCRKGGGIRDMNWM